MSDVWTKSTMTKQILETKRINRNVFEVVFSITFFISNSNVFCCFSLAFLNFEFDFLGFVWYHLFDDVFKRVLNAVFFLLLKTA